MLQLLRKNPQETDIVVSERSIKQLHEVSQEELDLIAEQFLALKQMTYQQFLEATIQGNIKITGSVPVVGWLRST